MAIDRLAQEDTLKKIENILNQNGKNRYTSTQVLEHADSMGITSNEMTPEVITLLLKSMDNLNKITGSVTNSFDSLTKSISKFMSELDNKNFSDSSSSSSRTNSFNNRNEIVRESFFKSFLNSSVKSIENFTRSIYRSSKNIISKTFKMVTDNVKGFLKSVSELSGSILNQVFEPIKYMAAVIFAPFKLLGNIIGSTIGFLGNMGNKLTGQSYLNKNDEDNQKAGILSKLIPESIILRRTAVGIAISWLWKQMKKGGSGGSGGEGEGGLFDDMLTGAGMMFGASLLGKAKVAGLAFIKLIPVIAAGFQALDIFHDIWKAFNEGDPKVQKAMMEGVSGRLTVTSIGMSLGGIIGGIFGMPVIGAVVGGFIADFFTSEEMKGQIGKWWFEVTELVESEIKNGFPALRTYIKEMFTSWWDRVTNLWGEYNKDFNKIIEDSEKTLNAYIEARKKSNGQVPGYGEKITAQGIQSLDETAQWRKLTDEFMEADPYLSLKDAQDRASKMLDNNFYKKERERASQIRLAEERRFTKDITREDLDFISTLRKDNSVDKLIKDKDTQQINAFNTVSNKEGRDVGFIEGLIVQPLLDAIDDIKNGGWGAFFGAKKANADENGISTIPKVIETTEAERLKDRRMEWEDPIVLEAKRKRLDRERSDRYRMYKEREYGDEITRARTLAEVEENAYKKSMEDISFKIKDNTEVNLEIQKNISKIVEEFYKFIRDNFGNVGGSILDGIVSSGIPLIAGGFNRVVTRLVKTVSDKGNNISDEGKPLSRNLVDALVSMISKNEGHYGSVNRDDAGSGVSLGRGQWNAGRAQNLLKQFRDSDPELFRKYMGEEVFSSLDDSSKWLGRKSGENRMIFSSQDKENFHRMMKENEKFRLIQDNQLKKDAAGYLKHAESLGITDPKAQLFYSDLAHQYGFGSAARQNGARQFLRNGTDLESIFNASLTGSYDNRRKHTYDKVSGYQEMPEVLVPKGSASAVVNRTTESANRVIAKSFNDMIKPVVEKLEHAIEVSVEKDKTSNIAVVTSDSSSSSVGGSSTSSTVVGGGGDDTSVPAHVLNYVFGVGIGGDNIFSNE